MAAGTDWHAAGDVPTCWASSVSLEVDVAASSSFPQKSDSELARGMHYPTSWDPYFKGYMTLADVYRYPTQHFEHHRRQPTLGALD